MISITKEFTFDAAHRLYQRDLLPEENQKIFGKCCKIQGHTYRLRITVSGPIDSSGMIIHFSQLKDIVHELVIDKYDHTMLNEMVEFQEIPPTTEITVGHTTFTLLHERLISQKISLCSVVLYETPTAWAAVTSDA